MKLTMTALAAALIGSGLIAAPAQAQLAKQATERAKQKKNTGPQGGGTITIGERKLIITPAAMKQIQELQAAVIAKDTATIPAKLSAAKAVASTPDERYVVAKLQLQAALAANDKASKMAAIQELLATGVAPSDETLVLHKALANSYLETNQGAKAAEALRRVLELNPGDAEALSALSAVQSKEGNTAEALALVEKLIASGQASGAKPPESLYKRAVAIAYEAKMPKVLQLSRDWVQAYPSATSWRDTLLIYQNVGQLDETRTLDLLRLKRTAKVLTASDYFTYAEVAVRKGLSGEAKAVLEEGFAANTIKRTGASYSQLYALASQRTKGDREGLPAAPQAGASARQTLIVGDAYYGYGDYAKAIEFYRAALARPGADKDLVNLRIGMALARQGDKAGATAALNSVAGVNSELAKYWLLYLSNPA